MPDERAAVPARVPRRSSWTSDRLTSSKDGGCPPWRLTGRASSSTRTTSRCSRRPAAWRWCSAGRRRNASERRRDAMARGRATPDIRPTSRCSTTSGWRWPPPDARRGAAAPGIRATVSRDARRRDASIGPAARRSEGDLPAALRQIETRPRRRLARRRSAPSSSRCCDGSIACREARERAGTGWRSIRRAACSAMKPSRQAARTRVSGCTWARTPTAFSIWSIITSRIGALPDALGLLERRYPRVDPPAREPGAVSPQESPLVPYYRGYLRGIAGGDCRERTIARHERWRRPMSFRTARSSYDVLRAALKANRDDQHGALSARLAIPRRADSSSPPSRSGSRSGEPVRRSRRCIATWRSHCSSHFAPGAGRLST